VAFADVDDNRAQKSFAKFPAVKRYRDYRERLDKHGAELDAVVISTADHTHFHLASAAMSLIREAYRAGWEV